MIELNKIYNEDCLETMKRMPDKFIDLTVTSPPYDNLRTYNGYSFDFESIAKELYRVTVNHGVLVWIVSDQTRLCQESGTSFKQALFFKEIGFLLCDTMIYYKSNPVPVGGDTRYYQAFEYMFILTKYPFHTFNPIIEPRKNKHGDLRTSRKKSFNRDKNGDFTAKEYNIKENVKRNNVWEYVIGGGNTCEYGINHPAIFPEKLVQDHIISWSNECDTVYDPFMGSGTTAKMAIQCNRKYIGSEISAEYCKIAEKRISDYQHQQKLEL